ncbi:hypothetical protein Bca52824_002236 [Brassica carinata]|uniref:Uncharacterized protein n=1 Tax=Brassica carinata TaxID=52824 RepID=A0A8X7WKA5_BRACI|nr:hypothetical protein Bca52824_002236 [Brassica carinata]
MTSPTIIPVAVKGIGKGFLLRLSGKGGVILRSVVARFQIVKEERKSRIVIEELELPSRLFETGFEPVGRKRVNSYFNLRWLELIKLVLEIRMIWRCCKECNLLVLRMGGHTFSVMFAHYFLLRQLVTDKELELWWTFAGRKCKFI